MTAQMKQTIKRWADLKSLGYKTAADVPGKYNCVSTSVTWKMVPITGGLIEWDKTEAVEVPLQSTIVVFAAEARPAHGSNVFGKEDLAIMCHLPDRGTGTYLCFLTGDQFSDYAAPANGS